MHNRGNGKGGGIAPWAWSAGDLGVSQEVLDSHYMLQVALLNPKSRTGSRKILHRTLSGSPQRGRIPSVADYRDIKGLDVRPPDVQGISCGSKKMFWTSSSTT